LPCELFRRRLSRTEKSHGVNGSLMAVRALRGQFATASLLANCALARSPEIARQPRHERCGESVELARLWVVRLMHRDPARPRMTSVHWVLYDLPASSTALAEAIDAAKLPRGTR